MAARAKKQKPAQNRKEKRKQERKDKKKKKLLFFSKKYGHHLESTEAPEQPMQVEIEKRKRKRKELTVADVRKKQLLSAIDDEDKTIKRLEKILKLNKRKSKDIPKAFAADGLDYILELVHRRKDDQVPDFYLNIADNEMEDDLHKAIGRDEQVDVIEENNSDHEVSDADLDDGYGKGFFLESQDSNKTKPTKNGMKCVKSKKKQINAEADTKIDKTFGSVSVKREKENKKSVHWIDQNESNDSEDVEADKSFVLPDGSNEEDNADLENVSKKKYWEDIYGRMRDQEGNVLRNAKVEVSSQSGMYVPPAKRMMTATVDAKTREIQLRICKQMKGLLNRLNESNMKHVTDQIEAMYMQHSRNDINECLVKLIQESVVLPYHTPEKLVMEHALLIALLHCSIGSEVGAHCLQCFASVLCSKLDANDIPKEGKEIDNLLLLLCHLYTFKVTHSLLIYDILQKLTASFEEKDVELILLVLRSVGFMLRKDNPLELKGIILSVQNQVAKSTHLADQSRIRFMLDTIMAIRNNNMQKIPNYDPSLAEHLKKVLRTLQRKGTYVEELHISLDDLLKADERGRWWIVGSAWQGAPIKEDNTIEAKNAVTVEQRFSTDVLELARKQRMNTDIRKNVFCIIISAEDFMDAFEKLLRLGLKNQQDRDIITITFDCCLQEKQFNPYYAFLLEKFCIFDRKYRMVLQFALWDKFKDFKKMKLFQITNIAQLLVHLFTKSALSLSVLKTIELGEIDKVTVKFLRQILLALLLHESEDMCRAVFLKVAPSPKLHTFREGLRLFMMHFLLRNENKLDTNVAEQLKARVDIAIKVMNSEVKKPR